MLPCLQVTINRPEVRNAFRPETGIKLLRSKDYAFHMHCAGHNQRSHLLLWCS